MSLKSVLRDVRQFLCKEDNLLFSGLAFVFLYFLCLILLILIELVFTMKLSIIDRLFNNLLVLTKGII
jgi:hypothetical protein